MEHSMIIDGGQMNFKKLTSNIEPRAYAVGKAVVWAQLLSDGMRPTKWLKPSKRGTKVNFKMVRSEEELEKEVKRLRSYIDEVNEKFDTDLKIIQEEKTVS
jgi:hypothetical protein